MKLTKLTVALTVGLTGLSLAACSTSHKPAPIEDGYAMSQAAAKSQGSSAGVNQVQTAGIGQNGQFQGKDVDTSWMNSTTRRVAQQMGIANNTVYFGFDQSSVSTNYNKLVQANANYLLAHPGAKVRLEGNTDPRGSREYNIGLGQRRSDDVEQRLIALGVNPNQVITVSYGQEKLADPGDSAAAYALDRRVNIVYTAG